MLRPPGPDARDDSGVNGRADPPVCLRARVGAEVPIDSGSRAAYSTDASNYRQVTIGVVVQPGIALDRLNDRLAPDGWMFGPKPSTHVSCTIGGMVGNNRREP